MGTAFSLRPSYSALAGANGGRFRFCPIDPPGTDATGDPAMHCVERFWQAENAGYDRRERDLYEING